MESTKEEVETKFREDGKQNRLYIENKSFEIL